MKLSLSVRVAEKFLAKREANMTLQQLASLAAQHGYDALCMRASQVGVHSSPEAVVGARILLAKHGLPISMLTGDFPIPENNDDEGPRALRNITPYLDLAEQLGASLLRICIKTDEDLEWTRRACDEAAERGMRLAHQCHTRSLFEEIDRTLATIASIARPNFGLIYEPANLDLCGQDYGPDTIHRFAPHIFNVYLQNHVIDPDGDSALETWCRGEVRFRQVPIWTDQGIDFAPIITALSDLGYRGHITIHQASADLGTETAVATSARYLRSLGVSD